MKDFLDRYWGAISLFGPIVICVFFEWIQVDLKELVPVLLILIMFQITGLGLYMFESNEDN